MSISNNPLKLAARRGNLLVGCGVVLLIMILLAGIGVFFVATNWRGWAASGITSGFDAALTEAQIDPIEHAEIMVHVDGLMQRFEDKDITIEQLGAVAETLVKSPVIPSAMVLAIDTLYIEQSDLDEAEKTQARIDLSRYTQGLCNKTIKEDSVAQVLASVTTNTPDDNDIRLNLTVGANNQTITALKSADEVSLEELQTLIATAKAKADEAGITETPEPVDLSDEIAKAIGIALGEIADDSIEEAVDDATDDTIDDAIDDATDDAPATDDP
ncbi:MAG: hypothetical protein JKY43_07660 [Phycisphaerales bacterium]|nr:hypothetical protein [Phycisphaerales bacterium]